MFARPVDKDKAEAELTLNIKKATSNEETAPKQKHVRKCIVYTWDYHTSISIWSGLRAQPILANEIQTFKALIMVHKVLQEGHPITLKECQNQTAWLETCARIFTSTGPQSYAWMIRSYVAFILSKLRVHRIHPEFNGLWECEDYISPRGKPDLNEGYETTSDLMNQQDQIDTFQKLIFTHFRPTATNECRISALVPLVKESYGIYRFITSRLRALHQSTDDSDALEPLRQRYYTQHYTLRKFYYECSQLPYLTGMINLPKLGQEPPNLTDSAGAAPDPPRSPTTARSPVEAETISEQARRLKSFEELQRQQAERDQQAQENPFGQQQQRPQITTSVQLNDPATARIQELEREKMAMRGQYERDQMLLEQYDQRVKTLQGRLAANEGQEQTSPWRSKYETLAKLYSQLRSDHLDVLSEFKTLQLKTNAPGPYSQPNPSLSSRNNLPVVDR